MSLHIKQITSLEYKKIGDNTKYPSVPVYKVEVTDTVAKASYVDHFFSIPEFNLIKKLQFLFKTKVISRQQAAEMIALINLHVEEAVREADFDANDEG